MDLYVEEFFQKNNIVFLSINISLHLFMSSFVSLSELKKFSSRPPTFIARYLIVFVAIVMDLQVCQMAVNFLHLSTLLNFN